jgi:2-desacetyl-2-hydroxyethyl bacteriochlorophyllide A dehydrogenase
VPEFTIHKLPEDMPLERAALVEPVAVACHVVQTIAQIQDGERVLVIGGGPIGLLISLVARHQGAEVTVAEISDPRIDFARSLGLDAVNPKETDIEQLVRVKTQSAGADAVFEVSSSQAGVELMPRVLKARGRMIVVAMFHEPVSMDLGQVFYQELRMYGSRVYEAKDFEQSIALIHGNKLALDDFVTETRPLTEAGSVFAELDKRRDVMKILLQPGA